MSGAASRSRTARVGTYGWRPTVIRCPWEGGVPVRQDQPGCGGTSRGNAGGASVGPRKPAKARGGKEGRCSRASRQVPWRLQSRAQGAYLPRPKTAGPQESDSPDRTGQAALYRGLPPRWGGDGLGARVAHHRPPHTWGGWGHPPAVQGRGGQVRVLGGQGAGSHAPSLHAPTRSPGVDSSAPPAPPTPAFRHSRARGSDGPEGRDNALRTVGRRGGCPLLVWGSTGPLNPSGPGTDEARPPPCQRPLALECGGRQRRLCRAGPAGNRIATAHEPWARRAPSRAHPRLSPRRRAGGGALPPYGPWDPARRGLLALAHAWVLAGV